MEDYYLNDNCLSTVDRLVIHQVAYQDYFNEFEGDCGYHFRNLKHFLSFITEECPQVGNIPKYAKLLRAQLSKYEIMLIYYNCLSEHSSEEFNNLILNENIDLLKGPSNYAYLDWKNWRELIKENILRMVNSI